MSFSNFPAGTTRLAAAGDVVNLDGHIISAFAFMSTATATVQIDNDGFMKRRLNFGTLTNIDALADWVRPNASAPGLYEGQYTNFSGNALSASNFIGGNDFWNALTTDRFNSVEDDTPTAGGDLATFDLEIRYNGGPILASALYSIAADREDF